MSRVVANPVNVRIRGFSRIISNLIILIFLICLKTCIILPTNTLGTTDYVIQQDPILFVEDFEYSGSPSSSGWLTTAATGNTYSISVDSNAAFNGSQGGLYMSSTISSRSVIITKTLDIEFKGGMFLDFWWIYLSGRTTMRIGITDTQNRRLWLDYGEGAGDGWEPIPIFDVWLFNYVKKGEWFHLVRNITEDLEEGLSRDDAPFTDFTPQKISSIALFQDAQGGANTCYLDNIRISITEPFHVTIKVIPTEVSTTDSVIISGFPDIIISGVFVLCAGVIFFFIYTRKKPTPRYRPSKKLIQDISVPTKESPIQKKIPPIQPTLSREVKSRKPAEPSPDLPISKSFPKVSKPKSYIPIVSLASEPAKETITETPPKEPVSDELRSLFRSIYYQVQDLIFERGDTGPIVRIIPYSGSIKEIKAHFDQNQIIMSWNHTGENFPRINLEMKIDEAPRIPSYDDPWTDITLAGEEKIIQQIKLRNEIANRLLSLGSAVVKVESHIKGELNLQLTCNADVEAIKQAYSLIKDLQLFFDISSY